MGVGFGTHYLLGQAGVESESLKAAASIGAGHGAGVGLTYLATGKMPGLGTQAKGLVLGLGGAFFVGDCYNSLLNSAGVGINSTARSAPAQVGIGIGGGMVAMAAGTIALPFTAFAIANKVPEIVYSKEDYAAKQSEVGKAREEMRKTYENNSGFKSAMALTALTLTFVPIFDGLLTLGSDATAAPFNRDPDYSPDRLTPAERTALAKKQAQDKASAATPKTPVNPLSLQTRFIPGFMPSMSKLPIRF
ncbi:MAG: hypothetical protein PHG97_07635 [Candidatus Margulisbacteria bacterium]|nr:hypothetical protein [Candidatus Margulisiibacteriota bacterium]